MKKSRSAKAKTLRLRLRVNYGELIALGPGKADLLEAIERTGSISDAARQLAMSYMRAWNLVQTMQHCFREPLVEAVRGGQSRGGARLTETGRRVLAIYREMESACLKETRRHWPRLRALLR